MNADDTLIELAAVESGPAPDPDVELMIGEAGPKGRRATRRTLRTILQHDHRWSSRLRRDVFRERTVLDGKPLTDADLTRTSCWIEEVYQATPSRDLVYEVAMCVADDNAFHPVRDYLEGLSWDGTPRAQSLLPLVLGTDDTALHREIGRAFLVGAAARILQPGCKLDTMMVLVGAQGIGKSRFCAGLVPERDWFGDTAIDLRSKDAYLALRGKWLYELAEMEALRGRSATRVKPSCPARWTVTALPTPERPKTIRARACSSAPQITPISLTTAQDPAASGQCASTGSISKRWSATAISSGPRRLPAFAVEKDGTSMPPSRSSAPNSRASIR